MCMQQCMQNSRQHTRFLARTGTYTGAWSMMMTHGVAVRFRFVVISFTNLQHERCLMTYPVPTVAHTMCRLTVR